MIFARWLFLLVLPILAAGCAITPQPAVTHLCAFKSFELTVEQPPNSGGARRDSFGQLLGRSLFTDTASERTDVDPSMLFLSGGSLHGAFGAGFLADWKAANGGRLPAFKVVTGISTGAILATFAFVDTPERAVDGYTIERESELLLPFGEVKNGEPATSAYAQLLRKGALADLAPLRARLRAFIDEPMLRRVHEEAQRGRQLLIGVVDVDTGQAVILDLADMARQAVEAPDAASRARKHDCYVEAILASSSAPLAALPVFIDNRMYVDGGMRFGMFTDELGAEIDRARGTAKPAIYLLINGDQATSTRCGKKDPANCPGGADPPANVDGAHADWSFPDLALRSQSILANQVYRFSASAVAQSAQRRGLAFRLIKIEPDLGAHRSPRENGTPLPGAQSCADWRKQDRAEGDPLQFYPRYMRCVIDYGRSRVPIERQKWAQPGG